MNWLIEKIKDGGDKNAVIFQEHEYSYNALYERIWCDYARVQNTFKPGEVVAIVSD